MYEDELREIEQNNIGVITLSGQGIIIVSNERFDRIFGEGMNYPFYKLLHPHDVNRLKDALLQAMPMAGSCAAVRMMKMDGTYDWYVLFAFNTGNKKDGNYLYETDITTLRHVDRINYLKTQEIEKYRGILNLQNDIYFEYDTASHEFRLYRIHNGKTIDIVHEAYDTWAERVRPQIDAESLSAFDALSLHLKKKQNRCELKIKHSMFNPEGKVENWVVKGCATYDELRAIGVSGFWRIERLNTAEQDYQKLSEANMDPATGLLNKKTIIDIATEKILSGRYKHVIIVIIDIDDFKTINDSFGHMFGDEVILKVANILKSAVGQHGMAGRFGGDEFFVVLDDIDTEEELRGVLRTVKSKVQCALIGSENESSLSCSMGISVYPRDGQEFGRLFKIADRCLYLAKEKGKNRYIIFTPEKHEHLLDHIDHTRLSIADDKGKVKNKEAELQQIFDKTLREGIKAVPSVLSQITILMDLQRVSVFNCEDGICNCLYRIGNPYLDEKIFIQTIKSSQDIFQDGNGFFVDNIRYLAGTHENLFQNFEKDEIFSLAQVVLTNEDGTHYLFSFERLKNVNMWSNEDKFYLNIFARIICSTFK